MLQSNLIKRIIEAIPGIDKANPKSITMSPNIILTKDKSGKEKQEKWNHRSLIGMLNYLVNTEYPELAYSVHQCARFCNEPKYSHEQAVKEIIRYPFNTKIDPEDKSKYHGLMFKIDPSQSIMCYVDASFVGD